MTSRRPQSEVRRQTANGIVRCCSQCCTWKPETDVHYHRRKAEPSQHRAAGYSSDCRACTSKRYRPRGPYRKGRDEVRAESERFAIPPCALDCWRGVVPAREEVAESQRWRWVCR